MAVQDFGSSAFEGSRYDTVHNEPTTKFGGRSCRVRQQSLAGHGSVPAVDGRWAREAIFVLMGSHLLAAALVALVITPDAAPSDGRSAAAEYPVALTSVTKALRTYEQCLSASRGRNQCSAKF